MRKREFIKPNPRMPRKLMKLFDQPMPKKLLKTKITANIISPSPLQGEGRDEVMPDFSATGSRLLFPGWLKVDSDARGDDVELPKCSVGQKLKLLDLESVEKFTEPPGRYSEAGLIKELEARGIGRPSTYAS